MAVAYEAQLYWDRQALDHSGWYLRFRDESGCEQGVDIDGDRDETISTLAARVLAWIADGKVRVYRGDECCAIIVIEDGEIKTWRRL